MKPIDRVLKEIELFEEEELLTYLKPNEKEELFVCKAGLGVTKDEKKADDFLRRAKVVLDNAKRRREGKRT